MCQSHRVSVTSSVRLVTLHVWLVVLRFALFFVFFFLLQVTPYLL